ncbi:hypothetical protein [Nocardia asteroides]|uniref:hypothetical protein n=1 Tax=Nocardia asteroides TaxID=1824 RepID=UPI001E54C56E|nr:hypothetical protein [Nocardia asteroides]UGT60387.1 hypothetical protein LTT61_24805 [Nocardia asteroides]
MGDVVTVVGACEGKSYLYGSSGVVVRTIATRAEVALTESGHAEMADRVVVIETSNLQFGRTDHASSRALFADVEKDIAKRSVQEAVMSAVDRSIISSELGGKILDDWIRKNT